MIPDGELLTGTYLRANASVLALGTRIVSRIPGNTVGPWAKLTQLDARDVTGTTERLVEFMVQLEVYATDVPTVWTHARTMRAALKAMPGVRTHGVVTAVRFTNMARIPDADFEPARERVILDTLVTARPV